MHPPLKARDRRPVRAIPPGDILRRHTLEEIQNAPEDIKREIVSLWLTDRSRTERPEVADEARTGLWYFDRTLFQLLPRLHEDLQGALDRYYPGVKAPRRWLSFAVFNVQPSEFMKLAVVLYAASYAVRRAAFLPAVPDGSG